MRARHLFATFLVAVICAGCLFERIDNPNQHRDCLPIGPPPVIPEHDGIEAVDSLAARLRKRVQYLAAPTAGRSYRAPDSLARAAHYIKEELRQLHGRFDVQPYRFEDLSPATQGKIACRAASRHCLKDWQAHMGRTPATIFENIELTIEGSAAERAPEVVVIGAHYDTDACESGGCNPGADDNASGVAALIELAERIALAPPQRTVRFVAFTNEEEPFFHTQGMGSWRYASALKGNARVRAMLSIETIGYYRDESGTQDAPWAVSVLADLPDTGNAIAFVGDLRHRWLVKHALCAFQRSTRFPVEGISAWGYFRGINWSDHWAFTQHGYPAVMVTDSAPLRNHCYHRPCDTPDRLDYDRMAIVVEGLETVIRSLAAVADEPCVSTHEANTGP